MSRSASSKPKASFSHARDYVTPPRTSGSPSTETWSRAISCPAKASKGLVEDKHK